MANWGYVLAGGIASGADAYADHYRKQREWNMKQKETEAEELRKRNYARFKVDLDKEVDTDRRALDMDEWKEKQDYSRGNELSGLIDPKTKKQLTNNEVKERGGSEGLVPVEEMDSSRKLDFEKKKMGVADEYKELQKKKILEDIAKEYGEDSEEYRMKKAELLGVPQREKSDKEYTEKEKRKVREGFSNQILSASKDMSLNGKPTTSEKLFATLEVFSSKSDEEKAILSTHPQVKEAIGLDSLAKVAVDQFTDQDGYIDWTGFRDEIKDTTGKNLTKYQIEILEDFLDKRGQLKKASWF